MREGRRGRRKGNTPRPHHIAEVRQLCHLLMSLLLLLLLLLLVVMNGHEMDMTLMRAGQAGLDNGGNGKLVHVMVVIRIWVLGLGLRCGEGRTMLLSISVISIR
jgi:hypothetical protein